MNLAREIRLGWRLLVRDWRAGEVTLIAAAIVIAVSAVTTVGFFTDRVQRVLELEANRLLGADLVISDSRPIDPEVRREAARRGLAAVDVVRFPSMVLLRDRSVLAEVRAVTPGYPLRGELRTAERLFGSDRVADAIPPSGTVWVDERLHTALDIGASDRIGIGNSHFGIGAIITQEPGVEVGFLSGAPRVILNAEDLPGTGLVQPGSRIRYRLLVAGEGARVEAFRAWAQPRLKPGVRIEGVRDARPEVRSALERAEKYLGLAALTSVLLAAVAIALSARRYLQRHLDGCAVMRCLGANQAQITRLHAVHFTLLGGLAAGVGTAMGVSAQAVLVGWLGQMVTVTLPAPGPLPALHGAAVGWLLLLGFALPPLMSLAQVPPLRVIRRELGVPRRQGLLAYVLGIAVITALILWRAQEPRLGVTVLGWSVGAVAAACALSWVLLHAVGTLRGRGVSWRFGVSSLRRRTLGTMVQVVALALGIMALLTLTLVRNDLARTWRDSLPRDAPNRFIVNILPDQVAAVGRFLGERGLTRPELFPMVRGRLVAIDGRDVTADDYPDERARRLVTREFNLSWASRLRPDNRVVSGTWWGDDPGRADQFSVEQGLAEALGIRLGDALTFDVAGAPVTATVTSLRSVDWDSFNVNFFVVAPPGLLDGHPATFVTSFHLPSERSEVLGALVRAFPNIVLIDVARVLSQVQRMVDQAALAVQFVFLFTLAAGLAVLYAAVASTQDERLYQAAILRALGASRSQIRRAHLAEFGLTGAAAGFVAAAGASGLAYYIARQFLHLSYAPDPAVWAIGIGGGALGVALAGHLVTRRALEAAPLKVLRAVG